MQDRALQTIAGVAIKYELPYDKFYDYVLVHHVPKGTDRGEMIRQEISYKLRKAKFNPVFEWIDGWTLKVEV
jgi:hypothetical protein